jgi:hypothetical protein
MFLKERIELKKLPEHFKPLKPFNFVTEAYMGH